MSKHEHERLTILAGFDFTNSPQLDKRDIAAFSEILVPRGEIPPPSMSVAWNLGMIADVARAVRNEHPTLHPEQDAAFWTLVAKDIQPKDIQWQIATPIDLKHMLAFYSSAFQNANRQTTGFISERQS